MEEGLSAYLLVLTPQPSLATQDTRAHIFTIGTVGINMVRSVRIYFSTWAWQSSEFEYMAVII